jgi:hypothetical protein
MGTRAKPTQGAWGCQDEVRLLSPGVRSESAARLSCCELRRIQHSGVGPGSMETPPGLGTLLWGGDLGARLRWAGRGALIAGAVS